MDNSETWWIVANEDDMVIAIIKNQELAKKFQQENEKYGYCYDIKKQDIDTKNERYVGYYLNNADGELDSVIDQENHCNHIHYKKVVGLLNQQDDKIKQLTEENLELKQALLYFMDCATFEHSSTFDKDMEELCKAIFDCSYDEANEKYGDFDPYEKWGLEN
ncbi:MAG: hypothetical protein IJP99_08420 [Methanobrevibacter sp.]|nr:hypothetical protein [Methanobrevibacter sp.]